MAIVNRVAGIPLEECNSVRKMMKPQQSSGDAAKTAMALKSRIIDGFRVVLLVFLVFLCFS